MKMKKTLVTLLAVGLVAGSLSAPASAAKKKKKKAKAPVKVERVVEFDYTCPCPGILQLGTLTADGTNIGGGGIPTGIDDLFMTAVIEDQSGTTVGVNFNQLGDDGFNASIGEMCGETEAPIAVGAGAPINVFIQGEGSCGGVGLGGTLTVTFSNLP